MTPIVDQGEENGNRNVKLHNKKTTQSEEFVLAREGKATLNFRIPKGLGFLFSKRSIFHYSSYSNIVWIIQNNK
jgi:hypothetical protein